MGLFLNCGNDKINRKIEEEIEMPKDSNSDDIKIRELGLSCLKVYIVGNGAKRNEVIKNIFKEEINDPILKNIADKEIKTDQFHWIARIYKDEILTNEKCQEIRKEIQKDKGSNSKKLLKYQAILCFGNENTKILSEKFDELRKTRMIFITEEKCILDEDMDKRYATNIIYKDITDKDLNIQIISTLWELDCCFNEKGNQICRYTPEKIFKGLEKDYSMFSINILLTGLSRTGKSTLINLLSGKIMALEGDDTESVTKKISEYYIYRNDDKDELGAIKIIDTPGIAPNQNANKEDYQKVENQVINMINNQDNASFENQIHFIFFVLMKGAINLEGENIKELLTALNKSKCPVYFIINKVRQKEKESKVIDPIKENLSRIKCSNLTNEENFILANFKKDDIEEIHGIDKIFKKICEHINDKKYLDENLKNKMNLLLRDFRIEEGNSQSIYLFENKTIIRDFKTKIKFNERMKEIFDMISKNDFFSKINIDSLIENGKNIAERCQKIIISLSNLEGIFPTISENIPALSIFQAVMVKEIAEGYGMDINILKYGTKIFINNLRNTSKTLNLFKKENNIIFDNNILEKKEISKALNLFENKVKEKLEKSNNKNIILYLANLLNELYKEYLEKTKDKNQQFFNKKFTNEISRFCRNYFENELIETKGLSFMINYFNKSESLLKDIEYYINKKSWDNYDIEIK